MSSFICSSLQFNSIERTIKDLLNDRDFYFPYRIKELYPKLVDRDILPTEKEKIIEGIIDELRQINVLCVTLQYRHHYTGRVDEEIKQQTDALMNNKSGGKLLPKIGLLKGLHCLNYQIELHHLTDIRHLTMTEENAMEFMRYMTYTIADNIACALPEYDNAKWSL